MISLILPVKALTPTLTRAPANRRNAVAWRFAMSKTDRKIGFCEFRMNEVNPVIG